MNATPITLAQITAAAPPIWPEDPFPGIRKAVARSTVKLVILDDDPTGTQTVHGMPVLTSWSASDLAAELGEAGPGFFILTNSRSLTAPAAEALNREIGANLKLAAINTGAQLQVISRSDSTLRGHFPGEVDALMEAMGTPERPRILAPCFFEGGRLTADDIHYVAEGERLIPAADTPYARDAAFGYSHSNLRDWVVEKTGGAIDAQRILSVSLETIRQGGPDRVAERLATLPAGSLCIVNALEYRDLEVFTAGMLAAEEQGLRFVLRSAASIVRVRAGIRPRGLLDRTALTAPNRNGGLFVVGSYVPKTSAQLAALHAQPGVTGIEVRVAELLDDGQRAAAVSAAADTANRTLQKGRDTVLFTSRELVIGSDAASSLDIGRRVSDSLIDIVRRIECQPRYLVAKGGITSSDVATLGLGVRRALVMGQVLPGVPVWQLGKETRWPEMAYIIFPGNVGSEDALAAIRQRLAATQP